jgi:hypothetical protein
MDIRYNINKLDTILKDNFQNVKIENKSTKKFGNYFEIIVSESKEVRIILPYKNIDGNKKFEFYYYSNPLNEESDLICRDGSVDNINLIIKDIIDNNRFDKEYLKN